jgi:arylsulfatase A-like enzyme
MAPNVLVLVLDACRRDALEPYGAAAGASPAIAGLADRGAALDDVYATACWTAPSHASMFSGKLPRAVGLAAVPGGKHPDVKAQLEIERDRLFPAVFKRNGYETIAASANLWIAPHCGFGIGVDEFKAVASQRQKNLGRRGPRTRAKQWKEAIAATIDDGADELGTYLRDRLPRSERPFMCFVNLIECHSPYLPPRPYAVGSALERVRVSNDSRKYLNLESIWTACIGGTEIPEAVLARFRRQYAASIRYMDDWIARLLEALDRSGKLDDTVIVVTSDHGENFGEAGLVSHAVSLDNRLLHVPFVVAGPGAGRHELSSLAGLPRFLAESAGIADHPWPEDQLPAGVGVAQLDPVLAHDDPVARETVLDRWGLGEEALTRFTTPLTCAIAGRRKLLRRGDEELWIDLDADPLELDPKPLSSVAPAEADSVARLRSALAHPAVTASRPFKGGEMEAASDDELRQLEEQMELLGYL